MHGEPGRAWSVGRLAAEAGMSRTSFAVAFHDALGVGPIQYLTEWRVTEAKRRLADRRVSVAAVAEELGYRSEAAFRRAFKRVEGIGPGVVRKKA
jgi:AraC family transcriptional activator of mtrCDE